jgi:hypothetical protein
MGRTVTPKYRVEYTTSDNSSFTPSAWPKEAGRANEANLGKHVERVNASFKPGGCNAHIGHYYHNTAIVSARLVRQADSSVIAVYRTPSFYVASQGVR